MSRSTLYFLLGALIVALGALGFIYYQDKNTISVETGAIELPYVDLA